MAAYDTRTNVPGGLEQILSLMTPGGVPSSTPATPTRMTFGNPALHPQLNVQLEAMQQLAALRQLFPELFSPGTLQGGAAGDTGSGGGNVSGGGDSPGGIGGSPGGW